MTPPNFSSAPLGLMEHLAELRRRLIYALFAFFSATALCYFFVDPLFSFLSTPLQKALAFHAETSQAQETHRIIYTGLPEAFLTYVKVALFGGFFLSFPVFAFQAWLFIAPGLYQNERRLFMFFLCASPTLFLLGGLFAYYVVVPAAWSFFVSFENLHATHALPVRLEARMSEYVSTIMRVMLAFGICFQLPVILFILGRLGVLQVCFLRQNRKYAFLIIVIISAIVTPPDLISPFGLIVPLYALYELSIWLLSTFGTKPFKENETKNDES